MQSLLLLWWNMPLLWLWRTSLIVTKSYFLLDIPYKAPTCLQLPLTLKINIRNLVLNSWSLRLYFSANNPASEFTLDKMLVQSFQMDLGFISKGTFSYLRKIKVLVSKYSKNNHQYSIYNQNSRLRLKKRYIYVTYETDQ